MATSNFIKALRYGYRFLHLKRVISMDAMPKDAKPFVEHHSLDSNSDFGWTKGYIVSKKTVMERFFHSTVFFDYEAHYSERYLIVFSPQTSEDKWCNEADGFFPIDGLTEKEILELVQIADQSVSIPETFEKAS